MILNSGNKVSLITIVIVSIYQTPNSSITTCFLYLLSPLELILMAGSFPTLPHLLIVSSETRKMEATSLRVSRSGRLSMFGVFVPKGILLVLSISQSLKNTSIDHYNRLKM